MTISQPTTPQHFRLKGPEHLRFGAWRRMLAGVFDIGVEFDDIGAFDGDIAVWATGQIVLTEIKTSRISLVRSPQTIDRGQHDQFAITILNAGRISGLAGPIEVDVEPGDVFFLDLAQPATLQMSVHGRTTAGVTLWIPRARILSLISDELALHGLTVKGTSPTGLVVATCLRSLVAQADRVNIQELDVLANGVINLATSAIAPMLNAHDFVDAPLASFVTIRRFIDRNLTSPELGPAMIAKKFGLSRASLYRLFEPIGGISGYIRQQRLNRAFQELTATDLCNQRIGQVAYRFGFRNFSAFSRRFRSAYGVSPREARKAMRTKIAHTVLKADPTQGPSLGGWLNQISRH